MAYNLRTGFEWDGDKSDACYTERGFDFAYAVQAFLDPLRCIAADARFDYGEARYQLLGAIESRVFFIAYTLRSDVIRIISARKANHREVKHYENYPHQD